MSIKSTKDTSFSVYVLLLSEDCPRYGHWNIKILFHHFSPYSNRVTLILT